jgi:3'-phosphoadenosine 5'-phosphosulfate sulfotransferase (PAPS reductase)/FAD synthetase
MNNVPGCQVAHIDTGIGIPRTQEFVRETCDREGWPLTVIRAKEDCGQDYDQIVLEHGFPGPGSHSKMYIRLKERGIEELVRRNKKKYSRQKVMFLTGICHDDSVRRSGYGNDVIKAKGGQLWVNAMYWCDGSWMHHYVNDAGIPRNPVAYELGMSGECLCGAFADKGELAVVRMVCPEVAARIERLQEQVRFTSHPWGWEEQPPKERSDKRTIDMFMCRGCLKEQERKAA